MLSSRLEDYAWHLIGCVYRAHTENNYRMLRNWKTNIAGPSFKDLYT